MEFIFLIENRRIVIPIVKFSVNSMKKKQQKWKQFYKDTFVCCFFFLLLLLSNIKDFFAVPVCVCIYAMLIFCVRSNINSKKKIFLNNISVNFILKCDLFFIYKKKWNNSFGRYIPMDECSIWCDGIKNYGKTAINSNFMETKTRWNSFTTNANRNRINILKRNDERKHVKVLRRRRIKIK